MKKQGLQTRTGLFFASEHSTSIDLGFEVSKAGYYKTLKKYELGIASQYDPVKWSPNLTLVLKRIGQPIPMYAKRVEAKIQKENEAVGFDLMVGDWVAPYGSGKSADFFFTVQRKVVNDREYNGELRLTFPNKGDGIVIAPSEPSTLSVVS